MSSSISPYHILHLDSFNYALFVFGVAKIGVSSPVFSRGFPPWYISILGLPN